MTKMREPRSKRLKDKPNALNWFKRHPDARQHFDAARILLTAFYTDDYHGFIDRKLAPQYRFNSHGQGYVTITGSIKHSTVRIVIDKKDVARVYRKPHCKQIKDRHGNSYDVADFQIDSDASLDALTDFLNDRSHNIKNFSRPSGPPSSAGQNGAVSVNQQKAWPPGKIPRPVGVAQPILTRMWIERISRSTEVQEWVKQEAEGMCECCGKKAPFNDDNGRPYLEVHHVKQLADKGPDVPENAIAICPNCHRELHHGAHREKIVAELYSKIVRLVRG